MKKLMLLLLLAAGPLFSSVPMTFDVKNISSEGLTSDGKNYRIILMVLRGSKEEAQRFLWTYSVGNRGYCAGLLVNRKTGNDAPKAAYDRVLSHTGAGKYNRICVHHEHPQRDALISFGTNLNDSYYTLTVNTDAWKQGGHDPATLVLTESVNAAGTVMAPYFYMTNVKKVYLEALDTSDWGTAQKLSYAVDAPVLSELPPLPPEWTLRAGEDEATVVRSLDGPSIPETVTGSQKVPTTYRDQPVTAVGDGALMGCSLMTDVVLPETVTAVGRDAFFGCASLKMLPNIDRVTSLGASAFGRCTSLTEAVLPMGIHEVPEGLFYGCSALSRVIIPDGVTAIGDGAFEGCGALKEIVLPASVKRIGRRAFRGCDQALKVTFEQAQGPVAVDAEAFDADGQVTLSVKPAPGTSFVCWADNGSTEPERTFVPGEMQPKAVFMPTSHFDQVTGGVIAGKVADGTLVPREAIDEMAFEQPVIEVTERGVTVGISLQSSETPDAWKPLQPGSVTTDGKLMKVTFPKPEGSGRFYRFTVPAKDAPLQ